MTPEAAREVLDLMRKLAANIDMAGDRDAGDVARSLWCALLGAVEYRADEEAPELMPSRIWESRGRKGAA